MSGGRCIWEETNALVIIYKRKATCPVGSACALGIVEKDQQLLRRGRRGLAPADNGQMISIFWDQHLLGRGSMGSAPNGDRKNRVSTYWGGVEEEQHMLGRGEEDQHMLGRGEEISTY